MDTEKFIDCVKKYPVLFNKRHKDYKNAVKKAEIWEIVASEMNETSDALRTKWKGLKDGYTKYKKQTKGSKGSAKAYYNWCWGPHLLFLDNFQKSKESATNTRTRPQDIFNSSVSASSTPSPSQIPTTSLLLEYKQEDDKSLEDPNILEPILSISATPMPSTSISASEPSQTQVAKHDEGIEKILNFMRNKSIKKTDAVDDLFMSYAKTLKKFSVVTQTTLKVEMAKLFAEAELREHNMYQNQSPYSVISVNSDFTKDDNDQHNNMTNSE